MESQTVVAPEQEVAPTPQRLTEVAYVNAIDAVNRVLSAWALMRVPPETPDGYATAMGMLHSALLDAVETLDEDLERAARGEP